MATGLADADPRRYGRAFHWQEEGAMTSHDDIIDQPWFRAELETA